MKKQKKPIKVVNKKFTNPWEIGGTLGKPVGEHTGKPVVLVRKNLDPYKVIILDENKEKYKTLVYGSTNPDMAYRDPSAKADKWPVPCYVDVYRETKKGKLVIWRYFWKNPKKRSDGRKGEGNF